MISSYGQVTIVSGDANSKPVKNLKDIVVPAEFTASSLLHNVFQEGGADNVVKDLISQCPEMCVQSLGTKEVQDLKKDQYDLVMISMFFNYCYLSLVDHFKV